MVGEVVAVEGVVVVVAVGSKNNGIYRIYVIQFMSMSPWTWPGIEASLKYPESTSPESSPNQQRTTKRDEFVTPKSEFSYKSHNLHKVNDINLILKPLSNE